MKRVFPIVMLATALSACSQSDGHGVGVAANAIVKNVVGRRNFGGSHPVITPQPVVMIATYDKNNVPNVMMAAWASQCDYNKLTFSLSPHKTTDNLRQKGAFTVSFATVDDIVESDYFGLVSGNDIPDKVERAGFSSIPSPNVDAPIISNYKLTLECRVVSMTDEADGGSQVVGEVVNWSADESILGADGKVDLAKLKPVIYDGCAMIYRAIGDSVGQAWQSGKAIRDRID